MATNAVNIGKGRASGMFYYADANTALPTALSDTIPAGWNEAGYISADGMTLELSRDKTNIKDWSNTTRRVILTDHEEKASGSCISTTAAALGAIFGDDNVTEASGTITVSLSAGDLPETKAYLFLMKDGDDFIAFGCSEGQIAVTDSATFTAGEAVAWPFEVTALGDGGMKLIKTAG